MVDKRGNCLKVHQVRFVLDIRNNFFTERVISHGNRVSGEVTEPPSLEIFQRCVAVALKAHSLVVDLAVLG